MASTSDNSSDSNAIPLTENDIPGASLLGRKPEELKNSELKFWLKCRGDTGKGLKTKAELVKRVYEYIRSGKDKQIIDPDPHKIYSRRKQKQGTSSELVKESAAAAEFPTSGWGASLEKTGAPNENIYSSKPLKYRAPYGTILSFNLYWF